MPLPVVSAQNPYWFANHYNSLKCCYRLDMPGVTLTAWLTSSNPLLTCKCRSCGTKNWQHNWGKPGLFSSPRHRATWGLNC